MTLSAQEWLQPLQWTGLDQVLTINSKSYNQKGATVSFLLQLCQEDA